MYYINDAQNKKNDSDDMAKDLKTESVKMEYDSGRCSSHDDSLSFLKKAVDDIKKLLRGDGNGAAGYNIRIHDLETFRKVFEDNEARKQRKYDRLSVALILQAAGFLLLIAKDFFLK